MSFSVTMGNVLCHLYDVMEMWRALMNQTKNMPCLSNEFKCNDGLCLHLTKLCDGQKDCSEGSDEANCGKDHLQLMCRLSINIHIPYIIQSTDSDSVQDKW